MRGIEQKATFAILIALPAAAMGARDRRPPRIEHRLCEQYKPGAPYEIVAQIHDASALFDPKVIYRSPPTGKWRSHPLVADEDGVTHRVRIPSVELVGPLQYFLEAFDVQGNGPAQFGRQAEPLTVWPADDAVACTESSLYVAPEPIPEKKPEPGQSPKVETAVIAAAEVGPTHGEPPPPPPGWCEGEDRSVWCEPWVWGVWGGVVVAGTVTAVVLATTGGDARHPETANFLIIAPSPTDAQ